MLFKKRAKPQLSAGMRLYAVGDIHGRFDLLNALLGKIELDNAARTERETTVIMLGDLIDRGPASAQVIKRVMAPLSFAKTVCLKGNHEAALLAAIDGNQPMLEMWLKNGGLASVKSWGMDVSLFRTSALEEKRATLLANIPAIQIAWLRALPTSQRIGDYFFVHAGVRPGVSLSEQREEDLLWIREDFTRNRNSFGAFVVHGHTVTRKIDLRHNRIGVDTGAHIFGRLSCIGLEDGKQWFLEATEHS